MNRKWDEEFDVISVGSGAAGLTTAIVAARRGARALVLEKNDAAGGVTALSGGQIWIAPNHLAAQLGVPDSPEESMAYVNFLAGGFGSAAHRESYIHRGDDAIRFLTDEGLGLSVIEGFPDYYYPQAPGSKGSGRYLEVSPFDVSALGDWKDRVVSSSGGMTTAHGGSDLSSADLLEAGGMPGHVAQRAAERRQRNERCMGAGLAANLVHIARGLGVEIRLKHSVTALIGESRVEGVAVDSGGGEKLVRANNGVVLATGGYDWNPELIERYEFIQSTFSLTLPTVTGDHFSLASKFGAAIDTTLPHGNCSRHVGVHVPGEMWGGRDLVRTIIPGLPHCILVNQRGKRFGDESFPHSYIAALYEFDGRTQEFVNWPAWLIFDQTYRDKYSIGPIAPGEELPPGMAISAPSVGELASQAGIDPFGLEETISRVNDFAEKGVDEDFGRGSFQWSRLSWGDPRMVSNPNFGEISKRPFYAIALQRVGTGVASAGLKTSPTARVLDAKGRDIPGLYALGNSSARVEMGCGYNSGMAIGRSLIFGYLAGLELTTMVDS